MITSSRQSPTRLPKLPQRQGPQPGCPVPTPTRKQRQQRFGIDCCDMVHFHHWVAGGEYQQVIQVKNVVMTTQKLLYKLPKTRYFSMDFPETRTLSAGMSWTIVITFRPVAKESYSDVIEFDTSFGKFALPIKATLPEFILDFPSTFDFAYCPIREVARRTFLLRNTGELDATFEWEVAAPFVIQPAHGKLAVGAQLPITIEYHPQAASVHKAVALCHFGEEERWEKSKVSKAMRVQAIGKYSHLSLIGGSDGGHAYDFGPVYVGRSVERRFKLRNPSMVEANFTVRAAEASCDPYFQFSVTSGTVPPEQELELVVTYTPAAAGLASTDYFAIATVSGNIIQLVLSGQGMGPALSLSTHLVNFGDVPSRTEVARAIHLTNAANCPARYQFLVEPNAIFRIDQPTGVVGPLSSVALTVRFTAPLEAINFHRRIYCLVEHQDAQYVDVIGTAYNDTRRPATFHPHHLHRFAERERHGLALYGPEQLEDLLKQEVIVAEDGVLRYVDAQLAGERARRTILDHPTEEGLVTSQFFYDNAGPDVPCTLLDTAVDFGSTPMDRGGDVQVLRVRNNSKGKMACCWDDREECAFQVTPSITDIPPGTTMEFRVHFTPTTPSTFYGAQLECFVYYKSMRNFRLVGEDTFTPPWCLTPFVAGNSFAPGQDTFVPEIDFGSTRLDFPSCHVHRSMYRTVRVTNTGDTTIKFAFLDDQPPNSVGGGTALTTQGGPCFSVKPRVGVLRRNESQLLCLRFSPAEGRAYEKAMKCLFNSTSTHSQSVALRGVGFVPALDVQGPLFFKPTCIESTAQQRFTLRNTSRIDVHYAWRVPALYRDVFTIHPASGHLGPNASTTLTCTFHPSGETDWAVRVPCTYTHSQSEAALAAGLGPRQHHVHLPVTGRGIPGRLRATPKLVDFGSTLIGYLVGQDMCLLNPTECDIAYQLEVRRVVRAGGREEEVVVRNRLTDIGLEVLPGGGVLSARSKDHLQLHVCLREAGIHEYRIYYALSTGKARAPVPATPLATIKALGVYQVLQVQDVRAERMGPAQLWQFFSIDRLNAILCNMGGLTKSALVPSTFDSPASPSPPLVGQGEQVDFDFGARPVGSSSTEVHLTFQNTGVVSCEYHFYAPDDLKVDIELWADPGDYTEEQLQNNLIQEHELFTVHPKFGKLEPGQVTTVTFSYSHRFPGAHRLPMMLKLLYQRLQVGRSVPIHLTGHTVLEGHRRLHLHDQEHAFVPVSIVTCAAPIQSYRLMNGGLLPVEYEVDLGALVELRKHKQQVDILTCLNPTGTVPAGGYTFVDFVFQPREVKQYATDVAISVKDGKGSRIRLTGQGLPADEAVRGMQEARALDHVPARQLRLAEGQIAALSIVRGELKKIMLVELFF